MSPLGSHLKEKCSEAVFNSGCHGDDEIHNVPSFISMCVTVSEFEPRRGNFKKYLRLFLLVVAMETNSHRTMNI